jgi:Tol biopolymer transport system component
MRIHCSLPLFLKFLILVLVFFIQSSQAQDDLHYNTYGMKVYTMESDHFRISYTPGLEYSAKEAGDQLEKLYKIYSDIYSVKLPTKTEVLVIEGEDPNGFAFANLNMIVLWSTDIDVSLRGTREWMRGVPSHEFAHIVSIWTSLKFPPMVSGIEFGNFSFANAQKRLELIHEMPSSILPYWFVEGIAQYQDSKYGTESWDTHRDMILRSLTLSNKLLSWDHMYAQTGNRGDDYEKVYNQGFSMVTYLANHYGYEKVVSLLRESSLVYRLGFDASIKAVLGISGRRLYKEWKDSLEISYKVAIKKIGKQVYGKKINKDGFDNSWPKFSPDDKKIFFLSNGKGDYASASRCLYSYSLSDTLDEDKKIKIEKPINTQYSICRKNGMISYSSRESSKSYMPASKGGDKLFDVFIDSLPAAKKKFSFFHNRVKKHQVTEKKSVYASSFSPNGDKIACAKRTHDHFYLAITDTGGKKFNTIFPGSSGSNAMIKYIFSIDWSPDGRHIAMSFRDSTNRKIGIYDTLTRKFAVLPNTTHDDRDPRYSADGKTLYFSSDRTGIFNIYRYDAENGAVYRLTNVSGGAFQPDVSTDEKQLVFAGYNENGYGIYLMNTVIALDSCQSDSFEVQKTDTLPSPVINTVFSAARPYSKIPNKLMLTPILITEEVLPRANDISKGESAFEVGAILDWFDIRGILGNGGGTDIRAYLFLEPSKLFSFINLDKGFFSPDVNYNMGLYGTTKLLPVTLTMSYDQRGLSSSDHFWDENSQNDQILKYGLTLKNLEAIVSHPLAEGMKLHGIAGYNWYNVYMDLMNLYGYDWPYTLEQGARLGAMLTFYAPEIDSRMLISPKGLYAKLQYDFQNSLLMNDDQSFKYDASLGTYVENFDKYLTQQMSISLKTGMSSPWYEKHDLYFEFHGVSLMTNKEMLNRINGKSAANEKTIPSYFLPMEWLPGYAYYNKDTIVKNGKDSSYRDTAVITGNVVASIKASYRFPLWPKSLDTKIWFLYFDRIYGALNFASGAGWLNLSDLSHFRKDDWLSSVGAEMRLEAMSFSYLPLAVKFRWDRGLNRQSGKGGGDRYTLSIGFSFDNWEYIDQPDYGAARVHSGIR